MKSCEIIGNHLYEEPLLYIRRVSSFKTLQDFCDFERSIYTYRHVWSYGLEIYYLEARINENLTTLRTEIFASEASNDSDVDEYISFD